MSEFKYAIRRLRLTPMFSIGVLFVLAILIGATASIFALVDGVVFKPLGVRQPGRVLVVWESSPARQMPSWAVAPPNYLDWQKQNSTFAALAAFMAQQVTVTVRGSSARVTAGAVTPNYWAVLGAEPVLGRLPSADADPREIVISDGYWRQSFGASPSALGQTVDVDDQPKTIVGVMPPGVSGSYELWTTLVFSAAERIDRNPHYLGVMGRLKPGVTAEAARADLATIAARLAAAYPETNRDWTIQVVPLMDQLVGKVRPALVLLLAGGLCVLLVGASNLTNLFLVRSSARGQELAVRSALGATRRRLLAELVSEAVILSVVGGAVGFAFSILGVGVLKYLAPANLPRVSEVGVGARTALFCVGAGGAMILFFGLLPALRASTVSLSSLTREGGRTGRSTHRARLQDGLVMTQVFISVILLTTALLFLDAFDHFRGLNEGFRPDGVLTAEVSIPRSRYATPDRQAAFAAALRQQLIAQPGVTDASVSATVPGLGAGNWAFAVAGVPLPDRSRAPVATINAVDAGYFKTLGIPLLRGRAIEPSDDARSPKAVVIDELLATRVFGDQDPIGRGLVPLHLTDTLRVVGVVGTVKQRGLAAQDVPMMYLSLAQWPENEVVVAVRGSGSPASLAPLVRRVVRSLDSTAPVSGVSVLSERMIQTVSLTRFATFLSSLFAAIAVLLGSVGVYAVLAFGVAQRRREIAIRLALGAQRSLVMREVIFKALGITGSGAVVGLVAARLGVGILASLLAGANPHDGRIFGIAAALMIGVGLLGALVPAMRSTMIDLAGELRSS